MRVTDEDEEDDGRCGTEHCRHGGWRPRSEKNSRHGPIKADRWCLQGIFFFLSFFTGSQAKRTSGLRAFARKLSVGDPELRPPLLEWRSNSTPAPTFPDVQLTHDVLSDGGRTKSSNAKTQRQRDSVGRTRTRCFKGVMTYRLPRIPRDMTSDFSALMFS
jgi:hypothetical protein